MKLEIKDYTKVIKNKVILDHIDLSLESGKIIGFFGRNGSGKTMLFRAITTYISPTEGDVLIDGISLVHENFDLSQMGVLIEDPGFYPYLTGYENLEILYTINHKKNKNHIEEILKKVGLFDNKDQKYKEYSLGMKQRLRIAQAIMEDQKIIILDEPTNGLDEKGVKDVRKLFQKEKENGKLILLASHNKEDLSVLCDTVYHIENGKIKGEVKL